MPPKSSAPSAESAATSSGRSAVPSPSSAPSAESFAFDRDAAIQAAEALAAELLASGLPDQVVATWLLPVFVHLQSATAGSPIPDDRLAVRLAAIIGVSFGSAIPGSAGVSPASAPQAPQSDSSA